MISSRFTRSVGSGSTPTHSDACWGRKVWAVISGTSRMWSRREVTARASSISTRPVTNTVRPLPICSSIRAEKGTDTVRLFSPADSSEVYSTVTFTVPATV